MGIVLEIQETIEMKNKTKQNITKTKTNAGKQVLRNMIRFRILPTIIIFIKNNSDEYHISKNEVNFHFTSL